MKLTYSILNRCLAVLLAIVLVSEASLAAYSAQLGIPSSRGNFADLLNLNPQLGFVTDSYEAPQASKRVVLIQDLHLHYPTQKRILKILEQLYTKNLVQGPVAIEGLNGPYDTSYLASFPAGEIKTKMVDHFMKTGDLSADEAFSVLRGDPKLLYGVDDAGFYQVNRALYQETYASRMALTVQLSRLQQWVEILKGKHYPRGLKRLSQIEVYDAATAEAALQQKVAWLSANSISNPATQTLVENLIQADHALFFLTRLLNQQSTLEDVQYVAKRLSSFISMTQTLLKTIQETDKKLNAASSSATTPSFDGAALEEVLRASIDFYVVALMRDEPMANNTLALLGVYDGKMGSLEDRKKPVKTVSSPHPVIPSSHLTSVALVTGGFHTAGITKRLKDAGVSYVVITPNLEETPDKAYHSMYVSKLMANPPEITSSTLRVLSNLFTPEGWTTAKMWMASRQRTNLNWVRVRVAIMGVLLPLMTIPVMGQTSHLQATPRNTAAEWVRVLTMFAAMILGAWLLTGGWRKIYLVINDFVHYLRYRNKPVENFIRPPRPAVLSVDSNKAIPQIQTSAELIQQYEHAMEHHLFDRADQLVEKMQEHKDKNQQINQLVNAHEGRKKEIKRTSYIEQQMSLLNHALALMVEETLAFDTQSGQAATNVDIPVVSQVNPTEIPEVISTVANASVVEEPQTETPTPAVQRVVFQQKQAPVVVEKVILKPVEEVAARSYGQYRIRLVADEKGISFQLVDFWGQTKPNQKPSQVKHHTFIRWSGFHGTNKKRADNHRMTVIQKELDSLLRDARMIAEHDLQQVVEVIVKKGTQETDRAKSGYLNNRNLFLGALNTFNGENESRSISTKVGSKTHFNPVFVTQAEFRGLNSVAPKFEKTYHHYVKIIEDEIPGHDQQSIRGVRILVYKRNYATQIDDQYDNEKIDRPRSEKLGFPVDLSFIPFSELNSLPKVEQGQLVFRQLRRTLEDRWIVSSMVDPTIQFDVSTFHGLPPAILNDGSQLNNYFLLKPLVSNVSVLGTDARLKHRLDEWEAEMKKHASEQLTISASDRGLEANGLFLYKQGRYYWCQTIEQMKTANLIHSFTGELLPGVERLEDRVNRIFTNTNQDELGRIAEFVTLLNGVFYVNYATEIEQLGLRSFEQPVIITGTWGQRLLNPLDSLHESISRKGFVFKSKKYELKKPKLTSLPGGNTGQLTKVSRSYIGLAFLFADQVNRYASFIPGQAGVALHVIAVLSFAISVIVIGGMLVHAILGWFQRGRQLREQAYIWARQLQIQHLNPVTASLTASVTSISLRSLMNRTGIQISAGKAEIKARATLAWQA